MFKRQIGFSILLIGVCAVPCVASSNSAWTWVNGSKVYSEQGVYGAKGVADPNNVPGARESSISWADSSGNLWLFGGIGDTASDGSNLNLNDLWKFDGTNWIWVSGSNSANQYGIYGTKGVAGPNNIPGARYNSVSWTDGNGNLWLFGGQGYAVSGNRGTLNDLWKFNGTNWTWVGGSNATGQPGVYGTKGVAASGNIPGARTGAVCWIDAGGNFWLFGGSGYAAMGTGYLNDLWKFDGTNWTWVSGSKYSDLYQYGIYGTKGVTTPSNMPGARGGSVSWIDADGNLWLFGGYGYTASGSANYLNDLWKFDGTNWTWVSGSSSVGQSGVYGTKGVAASSNVPGARCNSVSWTDDSGNLWLFGGYVYTTSTTGCFNDLWKFDGTNWTWVSGLDATGQLGVYGTKGVAATSNVPGGRQNSISWTDGSGNLWLSGGSGPGVIYGGRLNDLWKFDGTNWTWVSGSNVNSYGVYGTKGVAAPSNVPGAREDSVSWTDCSSNLWLFGGYGYAASTTGRLNDLWKFDGTNWTWVSGSIANGQPGVYGTKGVAAPSNVPGARENPISWTDGSGNLWLFGGWGNAASGSASRLNDLWKFDGMNWTWVSGSDITNQPGIYGTKGVAAPGNVPGARDGSVSWTDSSGNLWLFGGWGYAASGYSDLLNDLWKFDGVNWTWVSGSDATGQLGVYGTKGVAAPGNVPGARDLSASWIDGGGNLWLFGGAAYVDSGIVGTVNDLWKFDGTNWTWVSGSNVLWQHGVYGTKGVADPNNFPGVRGRSVSWIDSSGNLWLFGGGGYAASGNDGSLNDLWKFDGANWTWVSGSNLTDQHGVYGTEGMAAAGNVPGARASLVSWTDVSGRLWLFGGIGNAASNTGYLNDLWKFGIPEGAADMTGDGVVDEFDLALLADQWLSAPGEPSADLAPNPAGDGIVNFKDFAVLAVHWMQ